MGRVERGRVELKSGWDLVLVLIFGRLHCAGEHGGWLVVVFFSSFFLFFPSFLGRIALHRDGVTSRREGAG